MEMESTGYTNDGFVADNGRRQRKYTGTSEIYEM